MMLTTSAMDSVVAVPEPGHNLVISEQNKRLIWESWTLVENNLGVQATQLFYQRLFIVHPDVRFMFRRTSMNLQAQKLFETLQVAVRLVHDLQQIVPTLQELGVRHGCHYGVVRTHYSAVTSVMVTVLDEYFRETYGDEKNEEWFVNVAAAWTWVLDTIGTIMADAADHAILGSISGR